MFMVVLASWGLLYSLVIFRIIFLGFFLKGSWKFCGNCIKFCDDCFYNVAIYMMWTLPIHEYGRSFLIVSSSNPFPVVLKFLSWRSFLSFIRFIFRYIILLCEAIKSNIIFLISSSAISLLIQKKAADFLYVDFVSHYLVKDVNHI